MRIQRLTLLLLTVLAGLALSGFSSCETPLLDNYGFDLWCGDQLCGWEVEAGEVRRVATWHERDSGAELIGAEVTLSQLSELTRADADCFVFDLVADAEEGVELILELDFLDDGQVDYSQPIDARHWKSSRFSITPPEWFSHVRFRIRKLGAGRAVLAHVYARRGELGRECLAEPLDLRDRPNGAPCRDADECTSAACLAVAPLTPGAASQSVCGDCAGDGDCGAGLVCGAVAAAPLWVFPGCVPAGAAALGQYCLDDGECASGTCCDHQCAECCPDGKPCPDAGLCVRADPPEQTADALLPEQCDPGQGLRGAGRPCLLGPDCASGVCAGPPLRLCNWSGFPCAESEECPAFPFAQCVVLGVGDGVCQ